MLHGGDLWDTGNPMAGVATARLGNKIDIPTAASEDELRNALGCDQGYGVMATALVEFVS